MVTQNGDFIRYFKSYKIKIPFPIPQVKPIRLGEKQGIFGYTPKIQSDKPHQFRIK